MSASLVYVPTAKKTLGGWGIPLREIVREEYGEKCTLTLASLPFLKGVMAGGSYQLKKQCQELIDAINYHESIDLHIEY